MKAARNSAIACACLLAVIEGVGIGFQRMMAENTRLDVGDAELVVHLVDNIWFLGPTTSTTSPSCGELSETFTRIMKPSSAFRSIRLKQQLHSSLLGILHGGARILTFDST